MARSPLPSPTGDDCSLSGRDLPSSIKDNFESGSVSPESWQLIQGGGVGSGCGQLSPHAHGDSLYFSGCKMRQAVTRPLDLTRARYRYCQPSRPGTPLDVVGPLEGAVSDVVVFFLVNFLSCRKLANCVCS